MGGKKYPKKGGGSETSGKSQDSANSGQSQQGGQPQQGGPRAIRQQLQQMSLSDPSTSGQQSQSRPQQSQQQQQQQRQQPNPQAQGTSGGQQPKQQQQKPNPQGQGQGRAQPSQQQQQPRKPQQQQQQQQQQQPRKPQQQQQPGRPQQQQQQQQTQGAWSQQQQRGDRDQKQKPLSRAESSQSVRSDHSQGAWGGSQHSAGSGGGKKPAQADKSIPDASKLPELSVEYKGPGKRGRPLGEIETNYLKLAILNMVDYAFHYDVKIEPDKPKKLLTLAVMEFSRINFPKASIAFDGTNNAYASQELDLTKVQREVEVIHPQTGNTRRYIVSFQAANDSRIPIKNAMTTYQNTRQSDDPKRPMQALEVILKAAFQQPHLKHGIQGGRSFFLPPTGNRVDLGDFYELWFGLFQSLCLGGIRGNDGRYTALPLLNVDVNHKAFPKRYNNLIDLLKDMRIDPTKSLDNYGLNDLKRHLAGLEICYTNPGTKVQRIYKFLNYDEKPANVKFKLDNGQQTNVLEYFRNTGRRIQYPELNCIKLGNTVKNQSVPMEFCSIPDTQVINKKCTENQTRNLIRSAATSTDDRKQKIMNLINQIKHNQSTTLKGFNLSVDTKFITVPARLLPPPTIQYANTKVTPSRGVWRGEGQEFLIPESAKWGILNTNLRTRQSELDDLIRMFTSCSKSTRLQLEGKPAYMETVGDRDLRRIGSELEMIGKQKKIDILFCVIPDSGPTYAKIKQMAEIQSGVLTQCIKGGTVFRKRNDGSTISNILLKVNAKLNGTNHKLLTMPILANKKCMVIGADVTHPSPEQKLIPSVVGVAASHDANAFCYNICWRLQGQRKEMIEDFRTIMKEHLQFFKKKNGTLPEEILYYRDGVSEGQFDQVMRIERNDMLQACREIEPGYEKKVKMTIVVVQKRHHTRLFPGNTGIGKEDRKNNNVPAGTIVDQVITRPNENYFYLVSHQSIQGVAKPTKYCILLDEGKHTIDELQGLTYDLCHLFSRCNRSVSYPAPTYYAHLAAARGKVYIENERLNMNDLQREWGKRAIKDEIIKGHPMYFV